MKRRHQHILEDYTELRLKLFFFDENVQIARQALVYLEQNQGTDEVQTEVHGFQFDFGKSRHSFMRERELSRPRFPSQHEYSLFDSINLAMRRQGSQLFGEYLVPDVQEIKKAIQKNKEEQTCLTPKQDKQQQASDQTDSQFFGQIYNTRNNSFFVSKAEGNSLPIMMMGGRSFERQNERLRKQSSQFFGTKLECPLQTMNTAFTQYLMERVPRQMQSSNQLTDKSLDSAKSESGSSMESDYEDESPDSLGSAFYLQRLNTLTMERVLITQKKLYKDKSDALSRRVSMVEDDFQSSMRALTQSKININLESLSPMNKKYKRLAAKFLNKKQVESEPAFDKVKIKSHLMYSTEENKDRDEYKGRKVALFSLRRLAKKLKGSSFQHQDNDRRITEEDESDHQFNLHEEPQYGGGPEVDNDQPHVVITEADDLDHYLLDNSYESQSKTYTQKTNPTNPSVQKLKLEQCDFLIDEKRFSNHSQIADSPHQEDKINLHRSQLSNITVNDIMKAETIIPNKFTSGIIIPISQHQSQINKRDSIITINQDLFKLNLQTAPSQCSSDSQESIDDIQKNYLMPPQKRSVRFKSEKQELKSAKTNKSFLKSLKSNLQDIDKILDKGDLQKINSNQASFIEDSSIMSFIKKNPISILSNKNKKQNLSTPQSFLPTPTKLPKHYSKQGIQEQRLKAQISFKDQINVNQELDEMHKKIKKVFSKQKDAANQSFYIIEQKKNNNLTRSKTRKQTDFKSYLEEASEQGYSFENQNSSSKILGKGTMSTRNLKRDNYGDDFSSSTNSNLQGQKNNDLNFLKVGFSLGNILN